VPSVFVPRVQRARPAQGWRHWDFDLASMPVGGWPRLVVHLSRVCAQWDTGRAVPVPPQSGPLAGGDPGAAGVRIASPVWTEDIGRFVTLEQYSVEDMDVGVEVVEVWLCGEGRVTVSASYKVPREGGAWAFVCDPGPSRRWALAASVVAHIGPFLHRTLGAGSPQVWAVCPGCVAAGEATCGRFAGTAVLVAGTTSVRGLFAGPGVPLRDGCAGGCAGAGADALVSVASPSTTAGDVRVNLPPDRDQALVCVTCAVSRTRGPSTPARDLAPSGLQSALAGVVPLERSLAGTGCVQALDVDGDAEVWGTDGHAAPTMNRRRVVVTTLLPEPAGPVSDSTGSSPVQRAHAAVLAVVRRLLGGGPGGGGAPRARGRGLDRLPVPGIHLGPGRGVCGPAGGGRAPWGPWVGGRCGRGGVVPVGRPGHPGGCSAGPWGSALRLGPYGCRRGCPALLALGPPTWFPVTPCPW
jgi:hypothetical protein